MEAIDVQARLMFAYAAIAVLRTLKALNQKMTYGELAAAIGLSGADGWKAWHQQQIVDILAIAAAVERQAGRQSPDPLEFDRIVNAETAQPGSGIFKNSRIVRD